jgi:hypothetical protein
MTLDHPVFELNPFHPAPAPADCSDSGRMRVTVVFTSIPGTLAALETAVNLARRLNAEIVLLVAEEIYFRYALEHPPVSPAFFENLCLALVDELGEELGRELGDEIGAGLPPARIEILFCREQLPCLRLALPPRSLVVLGATGRWWNSRERRLERGLNRLGHSVLMVRAQSGAGKIRSQSVVRRMLSQTAAPSSR